MAFSFRKFASSFAKANADKGKATVKLTDPTGEQEPIKIQLTGMVDPTDASVREIANEQPENISGTQKLPDTETGIGLVQKLPPWTKAEFQEFMDGREDIYDRVQAGEELPDTDEEEKEEEEEGKTKKTRRRKGSANRPSGNGNGQPAANGATS